MLLPREVLGDAGGNSVRLIFGMPTDWVRLQRCARHKAGKVVSNMALWLCCKEEQGAVIGFLWSEGVKTAEMYCRTETDLGYRLSHVSVTVGGLLSNSISHSIRS